MSSIVRRLLRSLPVLLLATSAAAQANPLPVLSPEQHKAHQVGVEDQYERALRRCDRLQGHPRERCQVQARGERQVQSAALRLQAEPTPERDHQLRLARAEAAYADALVQCKPLGGQARDLCRRDARLVFHEASRDALLQREPVQAWLRVENTLRQRTAAAERLAQQQFAAARQRCELLPEEGRLNCLADARRRFERP